MLHKNYALNESSVSPINSAIGRLNYAASTKSVGAMHLNTVLVIYAIIEFFAVASSAYFGSTAYHFVTFGSPHTAPIYIYAAVAIASLVLFFSIGFHNFFAFRRQARHIFLWRGIGVVGLAFSAFVVVLFFMQSGAVYSRGSLIFQIISVVVTLVGTRTIFYSWLQAAIASNRIEARRIVMIGDVSHCAKFASRLKASGIETIASLRLPRLVGMKGSVGDQVVRKMTSELRALRPDDIVILPNNEFMPAIFDFSASFAELPVGVHFVPVDSLNALAASQVSEFGGLRTLQVCQPPLSKFDLSIKRAFDLVCAIIGLIVLSPLFLVISIAIKLESPGPIFFRQTRHGFNNDEIRVLKFRSMLTMEDGDGVTAAVKNDPRITRVGHVIRRTNIDELPQIINVLRGEMSLVGPRPHATAHNAHFNNLIAPFSRRHNVKPGITGWSQVNGHRGSIDAIEKLERRIEFDLYYIDNWSFLFDLKIIMMTLFSKKAYMNAY